jgi:hypothetical protein
MLSLLSYAGRIYSNFAEDSETFEAPILFFELSFLELSSLEFLF